MALDSNYEARKSAFILLVLMITWPRLLDTHTWAHNDRSGNPRLLRTFQVTMHEVQHAQGVSVMFILGWIFHGKCTFLMIVKK